jgi:hypothetical protein
VSRPDFEINTKLRGRRLTTYVAPEPVTRSEGEEVGLDRQQSRTELTAEQGRSPPGDSIEVVKELTGRLRT